MPGQILMEERDTLQKEKKKTHDPLFLSKKEEIRMKETAHFLIERLLDEKEHKISGGVYNKLQVDMAYNSNHIEGSKLTHEETQYIYDTHTVGGDNTKVDDIIETVNHFRCFDYILNHYNENLSEDFIKHLHCLLKNGTFSAQSKEAVVGDYKKYPNYVGTLKTSSPKKVHADMQALLRQYSQKQSSALDEVLDFHANFEHIHPFYDGNGRVGRLLLFKECLRNDIIPFIIEDNKKAFYIRGIHEWQIGGEKGYLRDTCLSMQDQMKVIMDYFKIPYEAEE